MERIINVPVNALLTATLLLLRTNTPKNFELDRDDSLAAGLTLQILCSYHYWTYWTV